MGNPDPSPEITDQAVRVPPGTEHVDTLEASPGATPQGVDVTTMLLAALLVALIVASGLYGFRDVIVGYLGKSSEPAKIVYVDSEKLFTAQLQRMLKEHPGEPAKGILESRDFVNELDKVLAKYADAGYLVLTKQAVLRGLEGRDVTQPVMVALGLGEFDDSVPNVAR
ncbi:hypothetical protein [Thiolapillus sp.]|uniref:hypothetical protein n=4 Tax=Thiolapillus sp. TaxID=2017437 RepID=UPI0025F75883|nr:hypothetical protein [Thiolapillus sp.]